MQALLEKILAGVLRAVLSTVSGWLISRGILSEGEWVTLLAGLAAGLAALAWMAWNKVNMSRVVNTAAASPKNTTVEAVVASVKAGTFAPALTAPDAKPIISQGGK